MASPYRIDGLKRPRLTPIEPLKISESAPETTTRPQNNNTKTKRKSKDMVAGSLDAQPSIINEEYLDTIINK